MGETVHGRAVVGGADALSEMDPQTTEILVAFADRQTVRIEISARIREARFDLFSLVDPDATVGTGSLVAAQSYVGPDASLADLFVLDSAVSVAHDVSLAEGATVDPNATIAGAVSIARDAFVGAGATILDDLTVGARAAVIDDVGANETVTGVLAERVD